MNTTTRLLRTFRQSLYRLLPKRADAIFNLLDAITSFANQAQSVVQLSQAPCFQRQYSSITDAIGEGLVDAPEVDIMKLIHQTAVDEQPDNAKSMNRFILDCTSQPRPYAKTLADRTITHAPNPAPGNKPICVGHQYSLLALRPNDPKTGQKHWLVPLSVQRVSSEEKGHEVGMQQLSDTLEQLELTEQLSLSIGDSLYGTEACRVTASQHDNLVHLFRLNSHRNVYAQPRASKSKGKRGRKLEYGKKWTLNKPDTHPPCHQREETTWQNRRGKSYRVIIESWKDQLLRGSRAFRSSQHPIHLVKVQLVDSDDKPLFKRPLWLGVFGKCRDELSLVDCYHNYAARYDIEHVFRFGKQKLLMDAYQTPDLVHEERWWQLCLLAYMQLYLGRTLVPLLPMPWERYLPEYKHPKEGDEAVTSPAQTQRGFAHLLEAIGTPAKDCVTRGKAPGRIAGEVLPRRPQQPVLFKGSAAPSDPADDIVSDLEPRAELSEPERIKALVKHVHSELNKVSCSTTDFSKILLDSG